MVTWNACEDRGGAYSSFVRSFVRTEAGLTAQRSNLLFQHSAQCLVVLTWKACDNKGRSLDFSMEPSIPLITIVPRGGQMERLRKGAGTELSSLTLYATSQHSTVPHGGHVESLWGDSPDITLYG